jgi:hypothetical protein
MMKKETFMKVNGTKRKRTAKANRYSQTEMSILVTGKTD